MDIQQVKRIIDDYRISMPRLALKIGISDSAFKKKIEPKKYPRYAFSEMEMKKLSTVVRALKDQLEDVCL